MPVTSRQILTSVVIMLLMPNILPTECFIEENVVSMLATAGAS
jgi:hypothetical protein